MAYLASKGYFKLEPDRIFLDVQKPGTDGFKVLRTLPSKHLPSVIFLTAYEEDALRAFEVSALDYLLKPLDDECFGATMNRARKQMDATSKTELVGRMLRLIDQKNKKIFFAFHGADGSAHPSCRGKRPWMDLIRSGLHATAHPQRNSPAARDHEFSRTKT
jgi:DNA-binding LytR/AlgR family response regulator